jgi:hypothetical protein
MDRTSLDFKFRRAGLGRSIGDWVDQVLRDLEQAERSMQAVR